MSEAKLDRNSLLIWWPVVKELGIPVPRTEILHVNRESICGVFDGGPIPEGLADALKEATRGFTFPIFIRTDLASGKHSWKDTCFVPSPDVLTHHALAVCEENELAQIFGLDYRAMVIREFLELESSFTAFNDFPVNRERRYFVEGGRVLCHHPYWPEFSIEGHTQAENWKEKLSELNAEPENEVEWLTHLAETVGNALPGCWSVDFAKATNGTWYLIDIAVGADSFHWKGCPNEKLQETYDFLTGETAHG